LHPCGEYHCTNMQKRNLLTLLILPIACYVLARIVTAILSYYFAKDELNSTMDSIGGQLNLESILISVFITPIIEEILFRKYIFIWLRDIISTKYAFGFSVFIFTVAHAFSLHWIFLANIIILGSACQLLYVLTGRLFTSIYVHSIFNYLVLCPKISITEVLLFMGAKQDQFWLYLNIFLVILVFFIASLLYPQIDSYIRRRQ